MKLSLSALLFLVAAPSTVISTTTTDETVGTTGCCLCEGTCDVLNEDLLIETTSKDVMTCGQLALQLLTLEEEDPDKCYTNQSEYALACCTDQNEAAVELFLPDASNLDEVAIVEEEQQHEESFIDRVVARFLAWSVNGKSWGSSSGYKPKTSYSKPTSTGSSYNKVWSQPSTKSTPYAGSSKCNLCYDRQPPNKKFQGVVIGHYSMKYTGSCIGLDNKLKTMSSGHQMCKVTRAQFQRTCGC